MFLQLEYFKSINNFSSWWFFLLQKYDKKNEFFVSLKS